MFTKLFLIGLLIPFLNCKKENDRLNGIVPARVLLTQKPWILVSHGFDDNDNNKIDPSEDGIEDCQKDNLTHFFVDGTGLFDDNKLSCANGIDKQPFSWFFTSNETAIDFLYDSVKILRLNDHELITYKELEFSNNEKVKFMLVYRH